MTGYTGYVSDGMKRGVFLGIFCFVLALEVPKATAFTPLGPYEPWMQLSNNFRWPFDSVQGNGSTIGGPMCLSNEYRWNVPIVTYGFDRSFLDFFGSNGVAAVQGAIQILNSLPAASDIVPSDFPLVSQGVNAEAQAESLYDLQSVTLAVLIEQMGLASPTRGVFVLRDWYPPDPPDLISAFDVIQRNFDPITFNTTTWINGVPYSYYIFNFLPFGEYSISAVSFPLSGESSPQRPSAVADNNLETGGFYVGLTADDVGGVRYLLSSNNINYETLLPGVEGVGASSFVNGAWRPGIEKITFIPHPFDSTSGQFVPTTNRFIDTYLSNGIAASQQLQRVITQPDFLFSAGDTFQHIDQAIPYLRTGTSNWINNADLNSNPGGAGPGVIQPAIKITFAKMGRLLLTSGVTTMSMSEDKAYNASTFWATFDRSTNAPFVYPVPHAGTNQLVVHFLLQYGGGLAFANGHDFQWTISSQAGITFLFQTSTNLTDWTSLDAIQNDGSVCTYFDYNPASAHRFYRVVPRQRSQGCTSSA